MSGNKTEQPTPKKIKDARKKGQIFKSRDIVQALLFITAAVVLTLGAPGYVAELRELLREFFQSAIMRGDMPLSSMVARMGYAWSKFLILSGKTRISVRASQWRSELVNHFHCVVRFV